MRYSYINDMTHHNGRDVMYHIYLTKEKRLEWKK